MDKMVFVQPDIKISVFAVEDVITTSAVELPEHDWVTEPTAIAEV